MSDSTLRTSAFDDNASCYDSRVMKSKANRILEEALALPEPTRAQLAGKLFHSLDSQGTDSTWAEAWTMEIDRRVKEIDAGSAKLIPWSQVRRDILRSRREPKRRKISP